MTSRYPSLKSCIADLETNGHLVTISEEVDPHLEMAEIQRRVYRAGGPALYFPKVKGTNFPCVSNLYGREDRVAFIFRDTIRLVEKAIQLRTSPMDLVKQLLKPNWSDLSTLLQLPWTGLTSLPLHTRASASPVLQNSTKISQLPQIVSWPKDGGAFITLPQVFSQEPGQRHVMRSNLGMYRVQMSGNHYQADSEIGLHYQIHRGIGVHHEQALREGKDLPVSIFVGGPPAHSFAAVMPLPEGLSELIFAGMLAGRRFRYHRHGDHIVSADADFCILGWIRGRKVKPEGPFGDHLGYYSLTHDFPYLEVEKVYHRSDAVWPFTVVGRPPQEDTHFGKLIHELTGDIVRYEIPGVKALHAVDASGVHPLLCAIGSERYTPYAEGPPKELLTQAHAILGFNQCSLAKYLFLCDDPEGTRNINDEKGFILDILARADFKRDLHFHTKTTIDTLDYSGEDLNYGSKLALVVNGPFKRRLRSYVPNSMELMSEIRRTSIVAEGILACEIAPFTSYEEAQGQLQRLTTRLSLQQDELQDLALIVICDNADFLAKDFQNFLWATFTRSNPSHDVYGVGEFTHFKHWGCTGPLVIDARRKPHHAPELEEDLEITKRVDALFARHPQLKNLEK